ncbi:unnamed protein product [Orchesella dallaii]|uniref:DUF4211 domain-containing protein n=1 Tax=Orchesella dallaii TaxID=48710 RepID=A0ABP1SAD9_9HEXA
MKISVIEFIPTLTKIKVEPVEPLESNENGNELCPSLPSTSKIKQENGISSAAAVKNGVKVKKERLFSDNDVLSPVKTRSMARAIKSEHLARKRQRLKNLVPNPVYNLRNKLKPVEVKVEVDTEVESLRRSTRFTTSSADTLKKNRESRKEHVPGNSRVQNGNAICIKVKVENGTSNSHLRRSLWKDRNSTDNARTISQMEKEMSSAVLTVFEEKGRRTTIDTARVPTPPPQEISKSPKNSRAKSFTAGGNTGQYLKRSSRKIKLESNGITPPEDVKPDVAKLRKREPLESEDIKPDVAKLRKRDSLEPAPSKRETDGGGLYLYHSARQTKMYLPRPSRSRSRILNVENVSSSPSLSEAEAHEQNEETENTSGLDPNIVVKTEPVEVDEELIEVQQELGFELEDIEVFVEHPNVSVKIEQEQVTISDDEGLCVNAEDEHAPTQAEEEASIPLEINEEVTPEDEEEIVGKEGNGVLLETPAQLSPSAHPNGEVDNTRKSNTRIYIRKALKKLRKPFIPNQQRKQLLKKFIAKRPVKRKKLSETEIKIPTEEVIPIVPEIKTPFEKTIQVVAEIIKEEKILDIYSVPNYNDEEKKRLYGDKQFVVDIHDIEKDPSRMFIWQIIEDRHCLRKYSPCRFGPHQFHHSSPQYWYFFEEEFRSNEFYKRFQPLVTNIAKLDVNFAPGWEIEESIVQYPFTDKEFFFRMAENMGQIHKTEYLRQDLMKCMPLMILQNFNSSVLPNLLKCAETNPEPESLENPNLLSYVNSWNTVRQTVEKILSEAETSGKYPFNEDTFKTLRIFPWMKFISFRNMKREKYCSGCFPTYQREPVVRVTFVQKHKLGPMPYDPKTLQELPDGPLANPKKATDWCEECSDAAKKYHGLAHFCYNLRRLLKQNMAADLAIFKAKQIPITDKFVLWMHDVDVNWRYTRFLDFQLSVAEVEAIFNKSA